MPAPARKTVLCVDDEPWIIELLTEMLLRHDYNVLEAGTVDEACRLLRLNDVSVVIADLVLKPGSGMDILAFINNRKLKVPFILMSGRAEMEDVIEAFQKKASDYLPKPLEEKNLLASLRKVLG